MDDSVKKYMREHHWGLIQGVSGTYCAVLATWELFHPVSAFTSNVASPSPLGVPMTQNYYMPWWLWLGIVALALSVAIPAIIKIFRKRKRLTIQEAATKWANEHNTNVVLRAGVQTLDLFTPLQMEAFQLSRDLGTWIASFEEEPKYDKPTQGSVDATAHFIDFLMTGDHGQWLDKFNATFELHWEPRIKTMIFKFGERGLGDQFVGILLDRRDAPLKRVTEIRCRITALAHKSEGLDLKPVMET